MTRIIAAVAACLCVVVLAWAAPVQAQDCPTMADFLTTLAEDYGEVPVASGTAGAQIPSPVMVFANVTTGSWTMVAMSRGCAVPLMAGTGWTMATPEPVEPGEDT
jgi:hypothetical protein